MKTKEARKFPLFKEYEFGLIIGSSIRGGQGTLLIPKGDIYVPKNYGFGELNLAQYLQTPFNQNEMITLKELIRELEEENELILTMEPIGNERGFLEEVLKKFAKHGIVNLDRKSAPKHKLSAEDRLSKGQNYDTTRVFNMRAYESHGLLDLSPELSLSFSRN